MLPLRPVQVQRLGAVWKGEDTNLIEGARDRCSEILARDAKGKKDVLREREKVY